jgi:hypothetical protein
MGITFAVLPPVKMLNQFPQPIHLCLMQMCEESHAYRSYYRQRRQLGEHVILDNGAHENKEALPLTDLDIWVHEMNPSELVLPDVLFDGPATVARTTEAVEYFLKNPLPSTTQVMISPQGKTVKEVLECAADLHAVARTLGRQVRFGISKDFASYDEDMSGRVNLIQMLWHSAYLDRPVHLLGIEETFAELTLLHRRKLPIRSCDGTKPLIYAFKDIEFGPNGKPMSSVEVPVLHRPPTYFDLDWKDVERTRLPTTNVLMTVQAYARCKTVDLEGTVAA